MDAPPFRRLDGFGGAFDIHGAGAGEAADNRSLDHLGDLVDRLEIALGGDRETGFDDIDAHRFEQLGNTQLLIQVHGRAGRLLAVAQRGVEDGNTRLIHFHTHWTRPFW